MKTKRAYSLNAYIGYGPDAGAYLDKIDDLAKKAKKTRSDFVLDAVEFYIKNVGAAQTFPVKVRTLPAVVKSTEDRRISYDELEDPPPPKINAEDMPSGKPETGL